MFSRREGMILIDHVLSITKTEQQINLLLSRIIKSLKKKGYEAITVYNPISEKIIIFVLWKCENVSGFFNTYVSCIEDATELEFSLLTLPALFNYICEWYIRSNKETQWEIDPEEPPLKFIDWINQTEKLSCTVEGNQLRVCTKYYICYRYT